MRRLEKWQCPEEPKRSRLDDKLSKHHSKDPIHPVPERPLNVDPHIPSLSPFPISPLSLYLSFFPLGSTVPSTVRPGSTRCSSTSPKNQATYTITAVMSKKDEMPPGNPDEGMCQWMDIRVHEGKRLNGVSLGICVGSMRHYRSVVKALYVLILISCKHARMYHLWLVL